MHQILHYSTLAGAGWLASNILFVIAWSWLHSRKRRWISDPDARPSIFHSNSDTSYLNPMTPQSLAGGPVGFSVNRAS